MRPCAAALLHRLTHHGGWMGRQELAADIGWSETVVDDELADLVVAGDVLFNARGREYRLGGSLMARRAARDLVRSGARRAAVMTQSADKRHHRVGLARRVALDGGRPHLVMTELELDYTGLEGALLLAARLARWTLTEEA